jgi:hypothetical protein
MSSVKQDTRNSVVVAASTMKATITL